MNRHRWKDDEDPRPVLGADGLERKTPICIHCGMSRITVIPPYGFPWHEWKTVAGQNWQGELTPPCRVVIVAEAVTG